MRNEIDFGGGVKIVNGQLVVNKDHGIVLRKRRVPCWNDCFAYESGLNNPYGPGYCKFGYETRIFSERRGCKPEIIANEKCPKPLTEKMYLKCIRRGFHKMGENFGIGV